MKIPKKIKSLFLLNNNIVYLNHGSFGACPKPIFNSLLKWQTTLENQPVQFLVEDCEKLMYNSRKSLSSFIDCNPDDIVFFQNPTTAINEIVRSIAIEKGDEILSTDHEYGAMDRTWDFICNKKGATYIKSQVTMPVSNKKKFVDEFLSRVTKKTKIIFLSHMTSSTGLYFPIKEICDFARENNIFSIIDGAHIPGHFPLSLNTIKPDVYVGACHKWLLCPKGVSFLYVNKKYQNNIDPLIISWGYQSDFPSHSQFQDYHLWQGTRDISPFLTIPDAIKFRQDYNWNAISKECKKNIIKTRIEIHNIINNPPLVENNIEQWLGQMCSFEVNYPDDLKLKNILINDYNIEIPVMKWKNKTLMRISLNGYNTNNDVDKLLTVLKKVVNN